MTALSRGEIVPADWVVIGDRSRRDLGDLGSLMESIRTLGLLNPPVVRAAEGEGFVLVAGHRRLEALRRLGWTDIPVTVADSATTQLEALRMERDENTERQPLKPSEAVAEGKRIEELERVAAKERQAAAGPRSAAKRGGHGVGDSPTPIKARAKDEAAAAVGMRRQRYEKAKAVVDAAESPESPAIVRETARKAVERMDATGNVSAALAAVEAAKDEHAIATLVAVAEERVPGAMAEVERKHLRARWSKAITSLSGVGTFNAEAVASVLSDAEVAAARAAVTSASMTVKNIEKARSGLRLVEGGRG